MKLYTPVLDPFLVDKWPFLHPNEVLAIYLVTVHQNVMRVVQRVETNVGCRRVPSLGVLVYYYVIIFCIKCQDTPNGLNN